jgi:hypothetical protein
MRKPCIRIRCVQKINPKTSFSRLTVLDKYGLKGRKESDMHIPSFSHLFHRYSSAQKGGGDEVNNRKASKKTSVSNGLGAVRTPESSEAADSTMVRSEIYPEYLNASRNPALEMC